MIFFFKSRIKYFNFFLEIQNNDLLIHLLTYLFLLWIQQVVYIILKNSGKSFTGSVNLKRHNCRVHEGHNLENLEKNPFLKQQNWRYTFIQFRKATEIASVTLVLNHSLSCNAWRNIFIFLKQDIQETTFIPFMRATKNTNVNLVINHLILRNHVKTSC